MTRSRLLPAYGPWIRDNDIVSFHPKLQLLHDVKSKQLKARVKQLFWAYVNCPHHARLVKTIWPNGTTLANQRYRKPLHQVCIGCFRIRLNLKRTHASKGKSL